MNDQSNNGRAMMESLEQRQMMSASPGMSLSDSPGQLPDSGEVACVLMISGDASQATCHTVVFLGDGAFAVRFEDGGKESYVQVNYGPPQAGKDMLVDVIEEASAFYRDNVSHDAPADSGDAVAQSVRKPNPCTNSTAADTIKASELLSDSKNVLSDLAL